MTLDGRSARPAPDQATRMPRPSPTVACLLSFVLPGLGQAYAGQRRRALLWALPTLAVGAVVLLLAVVHRDVGYIVGILLQPDALLLILALDLVFVVYRVAAIVDAYRVAAGRRRGPGRRRALQVGAVAAASLVVATVALQGTVAWVDWNTYDLVSGVFAGGSAAGPDWGDGGTSDAEGGAPTVEVALPAESVMPVGSAATVAAAIVGSAGFFPTPEGIAAVGLGVDASGGSAAGAGASASTGMTGGAATPGGAGVPASTGTTGGASTGTAGGAAATGVPGPGGGAATPGASGVPASSAAGGSGGSASGSAAGSAQPGSSRASPASSPAATPGDVPYWARDGRLDVLVLGGDAGPGRDGLRTDSMMLVSVDVASGRAAIFGFPRNLMNVPLPPRIANAYRCHCFPDMLSGYYRWAQSHPDLFAGSKTTRGYRALAELFGFLTGRTIDGVAAADLNGFVKLVDALGGLRIDVPYRIFDRTYPKEDGSGTMVLEIQPGPQTLSGSLALAFARTRHQDSDYGRMSRQQMVLVALRKQMNPCSMLPRLPDLVRVAKESVWTNIPSAQLPSLLALAQHVDTKRIARFAFTPPTYAESVTADEVARIRATIRDAFLGAPPAPDPDGEGFLHC